MKVKLTTLSHLSRFKTWINAALEAIQATIPDLDATEVENATETAAASLNELNERLKALEELVRGGDLIEAQKIIASREIEAPNLFSGNYNDLSNKPAIPAKTSDIQNDSGFITNAAIEDPSEVAAAALNEHERRIGAVEDMLGGEDGVELKSLVVTRELKAPNLHLEVKNIGAQSTAATILFPSTRRAYVMMTAAANITLNVTADASLPGENYVLLKNTSGSEITVTIGTVNGSGSNILIPEGGIAVPAGMYVEISYIVSSSMTIVSASSALTLKS